MTGLARFWLGELWSGPAGYGKPGLAEASSGVASRVVLWFG
jgi:hypothetical protein